MKAHLRRIQISPRKANIVAGLIRGKNAEESLDILRFTPKKAAQVLFKVLTSAVANAENNDNQKRENLVIKEIIINKGPAYKRYQPSARGRALPIQKPTSNISITLEPKKA